jgi:hypothetical protein
MTGTRGKKRCRGPSCRSCCCCCPWETHQSSFILVRHAPTTGTTAPESLCPDEALADAAARDVRTCRMSTNPPRPRVRWQVSPSHLIDRPRRPSVSHPDPGPLILLLLLQQ